MIFNYALPISAVLVGSCYIYQHSVWFSGVVHTVNFGYNDLGYNNISLITTLVFFAQNFSPLTATRIRRV